jgi:hypothetical protein
MTLELGFGNGVTARKRYRALSRLFGSLLNQSPVKRMRKKWNVAYFKALEETLIKQIWTPHFHLVWVFSSETPPNVISQFVDLISAKWRLLASKEQVVNAHERAVWAQELDHARGSGTIARYLTKAFYWNVARINQPKALGKPLDYAVHFANTADLAALEVWNAYEQASNGAHRYKFSKNWDFDEQLP